MSKYLTGHQVIATLNIEAFELVAFAKKGVLQPYTKHGKKVCGIEKKKEFENQDGHRLYLMRLELGGLSTGTVFNGRGVNSSLDGGIRKAQLEKDIKALENKGVKPLDHKQCIPAEYKDCIWESFDLPISESKALELIRKFQSFLYLESEMETLMPDEPRMIIDREYPVKDIPQEGLSQDESPEEQIKKIEIGYENDFEFKIKIAGKSPKPCNWAALGCKNERTEEFRKLLKVIQEGDIALYDDEEKKAFRLGCKKLVAYIKKEYIPSLPDGLKIFEKIDKGVFRLKFKRMEEPDFDPNKKLKGMTKEQLLQELQGLVEEKMPENIIHEKSQKNWEKTQNDQITNVAKCAREQGVTKEEITNIIQKKADIESVTDEETMRDDSVDQCRNEGLQII